MIGETGLDYTFTRKPLKSVVVFGKGRRADSVETAVARHHPAARHHHEGFPKREHPDIAVCAGWPHILKADVLDWPIHGVVNCHAGAVPKYRGGSPLNWQLINGESHAVLSLLKMTEGIDDGPVLMEARLPIGPDDDIGTLHERANPVFADMVVTYLDNLSHCLELGVPVPTGFPQQGPATYWHQRNDDDGEIDWTWPAERVHNFVRALTKPYPGAWTGANRERIWKTSLDAPEIRGRPGHIFWLQGKRYAMCGDRALRVG